MIQSIPGSEKIYLSSNYISNASTLSSKIEDLYSVVFLNSLKPPSIPNHKVRVKLGCVFMLLKNTSQPNRLCNGTRLILTQISPNILRVKSTSGSHIGEKVYIPHTVMTVQD